MSRTRNWTHNTSDELRPAAPCKTSKEGWPLGKANHELGSAILHTGTAIRMAQWLSARFGIEVVAGLHAYGDPMDGGGHYVFTTQPTRLGIDRYSTIRCTLDGLVTGSRM